MGASIVAVARRFLFVRETEGSNRGLWVSLFLRFVGAKEGDSWCAAFVCFVLSIVFKDNSPLPKTASCDVLLEACRRKGFIVSTPQPGDLVFSMRSEHDAHHIGIFTNAFGQLTTIAGNTSEDGTSSNGDGVYEHGVSINNKVFARVRNHE